MNNNQYAEIKPLENQRLIAALMQMSEAEVAVLLDTIEALQLDLLQLVPLFKDKESVETVSNTQDLLQVLSDEISRIPVSKQAINIPDHLQILTTEGSRADYAPLNRLLSKVYDGRRRLIWSDA